VHSRVLVLGAGFGGLELATILSDALGEEAGVTLIDAADAFVATSSFCTSGKNPRA
jgi:sulfide:quinone oxidoreductase